MKHKLRALIASILVHCKNVRHYGAGPSTVQFERFSHTLNTVCELNTGTKINNRLGVNRFSSVLKLKANSLVFCQFLYLRNHYSNKHNFLQLLDKIRLCFR